MTHSGGAGVMDAAPLAVRAPLRGFQVTVDARRGTGAHVTGTLLEQYGATVMHEQWDPGADADVILLDDAAVSRLLAGGVDLGDDVAWGGRAIRCAVTVAGLREVGTYPADELVAQALSGMVDCTGYDASSSAAVGVPIAAVSAALLATCAISALAIHRERGGQGLLADISMRDCCFAVLASTHLPVVLSGNGRPSRVGNRHPAFIPWNTYRASDRWIQLCGGSNWTGLCELIGRPEWREDPDFTDVARRLARSDELDSVIGAWCARHTADAAVRQLAARGIPSGVVEPPPSTTLDERPAPQEFELTGAEQALPLASGPPLAGLVVAEMGLHTAGPLATRVLAYLGATVVKVEPPKGDPARAATTRMPGGDGYLYELNNADKQSVIADLQTSAGRDVAQRVLDEAAVFVQNLAPGYVDKLDLSLDPERLLRCDISGFDPDGPRAREKAYDAVLQAVTGVMTLTGSRERPLKPGGSLTDQLTALGVAAAVTATHAGSGQVTGHIRATLEHATGWLVAARLEPGLMPGLRAEVLAAADGDVVVRLDSEDDLKRLMVSITRTHALELPQTRSALVERLTTDGFVAAPVLGLDEVVDRMTQRGSLFADVSDERRRARVLGVPLGLPPDLTSTARPAPALGQHTAAWADNDRKVTHP